ncbi:MAG: FmdB family zinc ribbon protein [Pseudomonadota bacterium]
MPVYEYQCQQCSRITESWQKISDAPLTECPHCSGGLKKLISCSSFHLKGSGWYVTDYAGKNFSASKPAENNSSEKKASEAPAPKESKAE